MLYPCDIESDDDFEPDDDDESDDFPPVVPGKSRSSERRSFRLLSSVCSYWHQTLIGWLESPTSQWVRHQLKKMIERKYIHGAASKNDPTPKM